MPSPLWLALLLALLATPCARGAVGVACETLTGVSDCVECAKPVGATKHACYLCHKAKAATWLASPVGTLSACRATTTGATCTGATGAADALCKTCDGKVCKECAAPTTSGTTTTGYYFNANGKCTAAVIIGTGATAANCQAVSRNAKCAACNPDGSCTKCATATDILVPQNAIYINVQFQESQCMTKVALNTEARVYTFKDAVVPTNCIEVDSTFNCARCADNYSLINGACVAKTGTNFPNGCPPTLRYQQYCAKCTSNKCVQCNGYRSVNAAGECEWPCKQLYGIGCLTCSGTACLTKDPKYANGR